MEPEKLAEKVNELLKEIEDQDKKENLEILELDKEIISGDYRHFNTQYKLKLEK